MKKESIRQKIQQLHFHATRIEVAQNRENKKVLESNKKFINISLSNHVLFPYYQDYLQSSQFWTKGFHLGIIWQRSLKWYLLIPQILLQIK